VHYFATFVVSASLFPRIPRNFPFETCFFLGHPVS
jgi:hypothetical protein